MRSSGILTGLYLSVDIEEEDYTTLLDHFLKSSYYVEYGNPDIGVLELEAGRRLDPIMDADMISTIVPRWLINTRKFVLVKFNKLFMKAPITYSISWDTRKKKYTMFTAFNPTKCLSGQDTVPIVLSGHTISETISVLLRLAFVCMPLSKPTKTRIYSGSINLARLQVAWYSADMGDGRKEVQNFLKLVHGGLSATKDGGVFRAAEHLGVNMVSFVGSDNITLKVREGQDNLFSATLYAKDADPAVSAADPSRLKRVSRLIRFDVTFTRSWLKRKSVGLNTIALLEAKMFELDKDTDRGFIKWLASEVYDKLRLTYTLNLRSDTYEQNLATLEEWVEEGEVTNATKLINKWLKYEPCVSGSALAEELIIPNTKLSALFAKILDKSGIDLRISRHYHEATLFSLAYASMSDEERLAFISSRKANQRIDFDTLSKRGKKLQKRVAGLLSLNGELKMRSMVPDICTDGEFYIYTLFRETK